MKKFSNFISKNYGKIFSITIIIAAIALSLSVKASAADNNTSEDPSLSIVGEFTKDYIDIVSTSTKGEGKLLQEPVATFPSFIATERNDTKNKRNFNIGEDIKILANIPTYQWCSNGATTRVAPEISIDDDNFQKSRSRYGDTYIFKLNMNKKSSKKIFNISIVWHFKGKLHTETGDKLIDIDVAKVNGWIRFSDSIEIGDLKDILSQSNTDYDQSVPATVPAQFDASKCKVTIRETGKTLEESQEYLNEYFEYDKYLHITPDNNYFIKYKLKKDTSFLNLIADFEYENHSILFKDLSNPLSEGTNTTSRDFKMTIISSDVN